MVRTQIYLDEDQKDALERLSTERHVSMAELIRTAIDHLIDEEESHGRRLQSALADSFGVWRGRSDAELANVRRQRASWADRAERHSSL